MKKIAWLPIAVLLVGCSSDDMHSLSRDYRNMNNECIDALMMVTGEARAKLATDKVLKPYSERIGSVDKRLNIFIQNADEKFLTRDFLQSESMATLFAENETNRKRLNYEKLRLAKLLDAHARDFNERKQAAGEPVENPVETAKHWPALTDLVKGGPYSALKDKLEKGGSLEELYKKFFTKAWDKHRPSDFKLLDDRFKAMVEQLRGP